MARIFGRHRSHNEIRWKKLFTRGALAMGALTLTGLAGCGRSHTYHADLSPDEMLARVNRGAQWMLWKVDATDEQKKRIEDVIEGLKPEVVRFHEERRALKADVAKTLETDALNQDEVARLRAVGLALAERAFNRSFDSLLQAAEVLTPEQRKVLLESWKERS